MSLCLTLLLLGAVGFIKVSHEYAFVDSMDI